jgi:hypothetical protein
LPKEVVVSWVGKEEGTWFHHIAWIDHAKEEWEERGENQIFHFGAKVLVLYGKRGLNLNQNG